MSDHCAQVLRNAAAGLPVDPRELKRCQQEAALLQAIMELVRGTPLWRIVLPPPPPPPPDPERTRPDELTTITGIRDLLINEVILEALKNPSFGQGQFDDIQLSDVYKEAVRGVIDELEGTAKNLRARLDGPDRK